MRGRFISCNFRDSLETKHCRKSGVCVCANSSFASFFSRVHFKHAKGTGSSTRNKPFARKYKPSSALRIYIYSPMAQQHPLAVESHLHPGQMLAAVDVEKEHKKSPNSRRRRRGSRRRSSAVADMTAEEDGVENQAQPSAESDPFFMAVQQESNNHKNRRRSSHTGVRSKAKHRASVSKKEEEEEEDATPAFQSLVDIISEMKRLPSISITPDTSTDDPAATALATAKDTNAWKRVRRHSEPPQKTKQQHDNHKKNGSASQAVNEQHQRLGEPVFTNSFLPLEEAEEEEGEENDASKYADVLVSPLNNSREHMALATPPPNRSRSQSGKLCVWIKWGSV